MVSKMFSAAFAGLCVAAACGADEPARTPGAGNAVPFAGIASPAQNDERIQQWVKIDCDGLHECAKAAAAKATSEDVKAFAAKMVADHEKWAPLLKSKTTTSAYTPTPVAAAVVKDDGAARDGRLAYAPVDFVEVKRKVCARMKALGEKEMKALSGAEFDRAFLKAAKYGHEAALAGIAEVRGGASSELAQTLDQAKEGLTAHLRTAETLCKAEQTGR